MTDLDTGRHRKGILFVALELKGLTRLISLFDKVWITFVSLNVFHEVHSRLSVFIYLVLRLHKLWVGPPLLFDEESVLDCLLESLRRHKLRAEVRHLEGVP